MKKIVLISISILLSLLTGDHLLASFRDLDYEAVREEGGFKAQSLRDVVTLSPEGKSLSKRELDDLATSTSLINLKTLSLKNQINVDDAFIYKLVNNPTFSRIITLRLEGSNITDASIDSIKMSRYLGSIRDLPQESGRYGIPSSVVKVYVKDTAVGDTTQKTLFNFHIEYRPPNPSSYPWEPVDNAVKIVEIETW